MNLHDPEQIVARRPLLIAHRGGVIAPDAPENSVRALEHAASMGYDMVELDVNWARDGVPVLFHGSGGAGMMLVDCGIAERIDHLASAELRAVHYRGTDQTILELDKALGICADLGLGVMLDMKGARPRDQAHTVSEQVTRHGLQNSLMTLTQDPAVRATLPAQTLWPIRRRNVAAVLADAAFPLTHRYWFDDPGAITDDELQQLQARGLLTIACLNSFRYPAHSFLQLERQEYARMERFAVDGYQVDSRYGEFFAKCRLTPLAG